MEIYKNVVYPAEGARGKSTNNKKVPNHRNLMERSRIMKKGANCVEVFGVLMVSDSLSQIFEQPELS